MSLTPRPHVKIVDGAPPKLRERQVIVGSRRGHLAAYMRSWNKCPTPFAWTKPANAIIKSHRRMLDRISTALH
jgi:hypothetical protein